MANERGNTLSERGFVPLHDYTQSSRREVGGGRTGLRSINFSNIARALGWFSLGLGLMEVLMPKRIQKWVGARGDHSGLIRILGVREFLHGAFIFIQGHPQEGIWSRVVGDALDLSFITAAFTSPRTKKNRASVVASSLVGITALDVLTATQLARKRSELKGFSVIRQEDLDGRTNGGSFRVMRSITINSSPEALYTFWRNFENLPRFMFHLESVQTTDDRHSHWVAKAPAGRQVAWDAEMTEDRPNQSIAWQSMPNAGVPNSGRVTFEPAPAGRGTVVRVEIDYRPPAGAVGRVVAKLFGEEPGEQVAGDLKRFKEMIETGEVLRSDGSPEGYGQRMQRPARPMLDGQRQKKSSYAPTE